MRAKEMYYHGHGMKHIALRWDRVDRRAKNLRVLWNIKEWDLWGTGPFVLNCVDEVTGCTPNK